MRIAPLSQTLGDCYFSVSGLVEPIVHVKCEALNPAGSIKLKPALEMIEGLERSGRLQPGGQLIESSSGNLGIALSLIAASKGYSFICVTDPNASVHALRQMQCHGSNVIVVEERDSGGGYLGKRLEKIDELCSGRPELIWVNQYANDDNWRAHYRTTGPEILERFPLVDYLFIGVGTGGTFVGCHKYFRDRSPRTRIVAVDTEGSVTFGGKAGPRKIPGLGTSRRPEIVDLCSPDEVIYVSECKTVAMCHRLATCGLLAGGSTGTVLSAIEQSAPRFSIADVVVTIMPDCGSKYLNTIYNNDWLQEAGLAPQSCQTLQAHLASQR